MELTLKQKAAYGIGAVGKDMVYALAANFVMYYYQDLLGLSATFVGLILMIARLFDAVNDPFMGILVAKTRTKWGRFRPWIISGTVLNALVLCALFAAPHESESKLMVFFSITYIVWGVTYTMMDIPYWSMIPAVTSTSAQRESLSVVGRTCAGVGAALISMLTVLVVNAIGGGNERIGFTRFAFIVAIVFIVTEVLCCLFFKENSAVDETKPPTVKHMFQSLFRNDQAIVVVLTIILINSALYLTSNFLIYFFKYDFGGESWSTNFTIFTSVGGAAQILGMMLLYPLLRRKLSNTQVFFFSLVAAFCAYALLLVFCLCGYSSNLVLLLIPGIIVFMCNGMLSVLTTLFLANSVDYGELKTGLREESVIFSMQTFVVKAAAGIAVFVTGIGLDLIGLQGNADETGPIAVQSTETLVGLRFLMAIPPMVLLLIAFILFKKKFTLTDQRVAEIDAQLHAEGESTSG